jgi:hypothetical protein
MVWNCRVIRRSNAPSTDPEWNYQIHEVYYKEDGEIDVWTENPVAPVGEDLSELRSEISHFSEALDQPILEELKIDGKEKLVEVDER